MRIIEVRQPPSSNDEAPLTQKKSSASRAASLEAEGGLGTEAGQIEAQADQARHVDGARISFMQPMNREDKV